MIESLLLAHLLKVPLHELDDAARAAAFERIGRATLYADRIVVEPIDALQLKPFEVPIRIDRTRAEVIVTSRDPADQPIAPKIDRKLLRALARAYAMRRKLEPGEAKSVADLVAQFGVADSYIRKILPIAFLAPDLIERILDGQQPARLKLRHITDDRLPLSWPQQRALFDELQR